MLIFVHGMWCDGGVWRNFVKYFEEMGFECATPDLNEGLDIKKARFEDYVTRIENMAGEGDIIIGHSMGGLIVQKVAERKRIRGGIAICSSPPRGIKFSGTSIVFSSLRFLPRIMARKPIKPDKKFVKRYLANCISEEKIDEIYALLREFPPMPAYQVAMGKIEVDEKQVESPMLFIAMKDDRASPPDMVKRIAARYGADFVEKEGCHWIFENWEELAKEISGFLMKIHP